MNEEMEFPNTFEEFLNEYSFKDSDEIYTNGSELIQTFRVMQGYEHFVKQIKADMIDAVCKEIANWNVKSSKKIPYELRYKMTHDRAIKLLKIERECINRNYQPFGKNCDRNCSKCDLVQNTEELLEMYDYVIDFIEHSLEK